MTTQNQSTQQAVKISVHRDLSIELQSECFSIRKKLTIDEALGLIGMLNFVVRDHAYYKLKSAVKEVAQ